ncbi:uncharacterized protein LOC126724534 [Quercus robur]|uniref:uncharacterized protein LOC126724534 n=1 Tax=Quercus robur TaxID=38942 RepID=UPI002163AEAB|nr:uncharacterized protein LOC126724534 [Quercus robur]
MVSSGHMVLTIIGSDRKADSSGNQSCTIWELLGITLNDMVQEIQNPLYLLFPPAETHVDRDCNMDESNKCFRYDKPTRGKCEAMSIRVVVEFILAFYFGGEIKDDLFEIFSKNVEEYLEVEEGKYTNMIISMTKDEYF